MQIAASNCIVVAVVNHNKNCCTSKQTGVMLSLAFSVKMCEGGNHEHACEYSPMFVVIDHFRYQ